LKRMRRNRESAAMSRNRKKQYVEELETQVASLHEHVSKLQRENIDLRRACARARGDEAPPSLPAPEPELEGAVVSLPSSSLPSLTLLDALSDDDARVPPLKRSGSPLLGAMPKRASAASLALMSAVTFVTLSVAGRAADAPAGAGLVPTGSHHGQRALMSLGGLGGPSTASFTFKEYATQALPRSLTELLGRTPLHDPAVVDQAVDDAVSRLWPSLNLHGEGGKGVDAQHAYVAAQLPPPDAAHGAVPAAAPREYAERVIRAPQNSSWADVLRIEAAEKKLAEAQLTLRSLGRYPPPTHGAAPPVVRPPSVEEESGGVGGGSDVTRHVPETTTTALAAPRYAAPREATPLPRLEPSASVDDEAAAEYEAQRYIFCSRAYMFDAAVRRAPPMHADKADPFGAELDLPSTMPARFRHGADFNRKQLPQVTDGNASAGAAAAAKPVVTLLLPSAALHGVRGVEEEEAPARSASSSTAPPKDELLQVQCQVLNASRVAAPL